MQLSNLSEIGFMSTNGWEGVVFMDNMMQADLKPIDPSGCTCQAKHDPQAKRIC